MMKSIGQNIKEIDNRIGELLDLYEVETETNKQKIRDEIKELTQIRQDLQSSKVEGSNSGLWISGGISLATILLVMKYEEANVITSKAYNIATRIFRG